MNTLTIVKSRSNRAGRSMDLVYDQNRGYNNIMSNYLFLKGEKQTGGAGRSFYLTAAPEIKFAQKDFPKKLKESADLRRAYKESLIPALSQFIYTPEEDEELVQQQEAEETDYYEEDEYED